jgi:DNA-binding response OmpR family regulator
MPDGAARIGDFGLTGCTVLLVEDEYLMANALSQILRAAGATVLGPAATTDRALRLRERTDRIDAAVLDINLRGETVYGLADVLRERAVPFLFTTGYIASMIPPRYQGHDILHKPLDTTDLLRVLVGLTCRSKNTTDPVR